MEKLNIDCILLAAGESTRMGRPKQAIPVQGKPMVWYGAEIALNCCCRLIVVQGAIRLENLLPADSGILLVDNPDFRAGQLGSLQTGLHYVTTTHCFVMLADLIGVKPDTFFQLADAIGENCAAYPVCGGRRGHPVLLNRQAMERLQTALPNDRAMKVLQPLNPLAVPVDDMGIFTDIDTETDMVRFTMNN